jgi:hypothetical protein
VVVGGVDVVETVDGTGAEVEVGDAGEVDGVVVDEAFDPPEHAASSPITTKSGMTFGLHPGRFCPDSRGVRIAMFLSGNVSDLDVSRRADLQRLLGNRRLGLSCNEDSTAASFKPFA